MRSPEFVLILRENGKEDMSTESEKRAFIFYCWKVDGMGR